MSLLNFKQSVSPLSFVTFILSVACNSAFSDPLATVALQTPMP